MELKEELNYCLNCKTKPCKIGCPLENDIPKIIELMKQEKYIEAYDVLTLTNALPAICGRICPYSKQCQGNCTRGLTGRPVKIGEIESWLADLAIDEKFTIKKTKEYEENKKINKKVAIVGAGPASLTCAAFLNRSGINVTIYEKNDKLGGLLYHGIPNFRLSKEILDKTVKYIINQEINIKYNYELGKNLQIEELINSYDAIFLGIGANVSLRMNIPGEDLNGVYGANELLEKKSVQYKGKQVIVIGGGNVALDMARVAQIGGAKEVTIIYRRSEKQMPAEIEEILDTKEKNINFMFQTNVLKILKDTDMLKVECIKTELKKIEEQQREVPVNIDGTNYFKNADIVIMAVGSKTDEIVKKLDLELDNKEHIKVDSNKKTSKEKIFAAGDVVGEKNTVASAARSGRDAAEAILKFIK